MEKKRAGFKGRLWEAIKADRMGAEIVGYKERIRDLRSNFLVCWNVLTATQLTDSTIKMVASIDHHASLAKIEQQLSLLTLGTSITPAGNLG